MASKKPEEATYGQEFLSVTRKDLKFVLKLILTNGTYPKVHYFVVHDVDTAYWDFDMIMTNM